MRDKNLSCVPLKDCPKQQTIMRSLLYKRYKSSICIIRNAKQKIRAMFGYNEIRGMVRCTPLFTQMYLSCIFNQLITPGSFFIKYLCSLPSADNFHLLLCCQLNFKKKGPFLSSQKAESNRYSHIDLYLHVGLIQPMVNGSFCRKGWVPA